MAFLNVDVQRLDRELVVRGLSRSRSEAARAIEDGTVLVDGQTCARVAQMVNSTQKIELRGHPTWVGRAALKLEHALVEFRLDVAGKAALDVGASTGGFTQVLLSRGAKSVVALDVGHGQIAAEIRTDPRVRVVEGFNARNLDRSSLSELAPEFESPTICVIDVSFISLTLILPPIASAIDPQADIVALIKPQFEVGKGRLKAGVVSEPSAHAESIRRVLNSAFEVGLATMALTSSPIIGGKGNREFLVWFNPNEGSHPTEWEQRIVELVSS